MKNEKGSSIVTALVIAMIMTVLLGGCFAIASSYHTRSIKNHQERQAYLTAKSIVDTIAVKIQAGDEQFIPTSTTTPINFDNIQLTGDTCEKRSAIITLKEDKIIVIVGKATNFGREQTVQLTLYKNNNNLWSSPQYSNEGEDIIYETE